MVSSGGSWQINWWNSIFMLTLYFLEWLLVDTRSVLFIVQSYRSCEQCFSQWIQALRAQPDWSVWLKVKNVCHHLVSPLTLFYFLFRCGFVSLLIKMNEGECPKNRKIEVQTLWWGQNKPCPSYYFWLKSRQIFQVSYQAGVYSGIFSWGWLWWNGRSWPGPCDGTASPWHECDTSASVPGY